MVNSIYPRDTQTLPAIQKIEFIYGGGRQMTAVLNPHPRQPGAQITHVDLECTSIRWTNGLVSQYDTLIEAGTKAHHNAQSDAVTIPAEIIEVRMTGEEFLTRHDMAQITGNQYPITVV